MARLRVGAHSLAAFGLCDGLEPGTVPQYDSSLFTLDEATVLSRAGIVALRTGEVLEDTLDHTDPGRDGYRREGGRMVAGGDGLKRAEGGSLVLPACRRRLRGCHLSLLLGNAENHFHWLAMNLARVCLLSAADVAVLDGVLVPAGLSRVQREWLAFTGLGPLVEVEAGEAVSVERLLLPWNVASGAGASVRAMRLLRGWAGTHGGAGRRIFVDRRAAPARRLLNEAEVIDALRPHGFVPVRLEGMAAAEQVALFRDAEIVVGCHGAGLANIAFAAPGASVVELMPSAHVNWCFRHMAGACGHRYDCVAGLSHGDASVPGAPWSIAPTHVLSALPAPGR